MNKLEPARTYNQHHIERKYTRGKRRLSIYWTWSYPWESQRDPAAMENRFSTMTEVRNVLWPSYETPEYSAAQFLQGIAGTLELFHRSTLSFQQSVGRSHRPSRLRCSSASTRPATSYQLTNGFWLTPTRFWCSGWTTFFPNRKLSPEEVAAIREWLKREGTCLLLAPHHDVGFASDLKQRQMEYLHHGDSARAAPATLWAIYPLVDEGA